MCIYTSQSDMPGGGRSDSPAVRIIGAIMALIAVVGYLIFGWSWGAGDAIPTTIGTVVAVSIIGWSFYKVESFTASL
jgi:CHASE2 domain-containing sensor protein